MRAVPLCLTLEEVRSLGPEEASRLLSSTRKALAREMRRPVPKEEEEERMLARMKLIMLESDLSDVC